MQNNLHSIDIPCTATKICLSENSESLIIFVATWDGHLLSIKYDEKRTIIICQQQIDITKDRSKPVLAVAELDNVAYVSAEVSEDEWAIYQIKFTEDRNFDIKKQPIIGTHSKPINQLIIGEDRKLYSFGFDGLCQVWDLNEIHSFPMKSFSLGKIVTQVQSKDSYILCVLAGESFVLINTDGTQSEPVYFNARSEHLKNSKITSLSINKIDSEEKNREEMLDFALGTVDGRVIHCEYTLPERPGEKSKSQNLKAGGVVYAHQAVYKEKQISFPINALAYHASFIGLLFSGGGEGKVKFHDFPIQKVYKSLFDDDLMPVSHILANLTGEYIVIAKGYGWHPDQNKILSGENEKAKIYIYVLDQVDLPS